MCSELFIPKNCVIDGLEKRRIACHKASHVTASWYLEHAHDFKYNFTAMED